jgi:uncharacterized protein (TIGR03083 family)
VLSADNLASIEAEGRRLGAIARSGPEEEVPQYPGWTLDDLAYHTAAIHGRTLRVIRERPLERVSSPRCPEGMSVLDWYDRTLDELLGVLGEADPTVEVWGFGPRPTVGFWERRMAIETGVHRWDAEQALGVPEPLSDHVALSGLDEFAELWLPFLGDVGPLRVTATDHDRTWEFGSGATGSPLVGSASDIFLRLMSRPSPMSLSDDWAAAVDGLAPPPRPDRAPRPEPPT